MLEENFGTKFSSYKEQLTKHTKLDFWVKMHAEAVTTLIYIFTEEEEPTFVEKKLP